MPGGLTGQVQCWVHGVLWDDRKASKNFSSDAAGVCVRMPRLNCAPLLKISSPKCLKDEVHC